MGWFKDILNDAFGSGSDDGSDLTPATEQEDDGGAKANSGDDE